MEHLLTVDSLISLLTLTALEIVLGIDNIVFISILAGKLPENKQKKARRLGLGLAMFVRILLLLSISWIMSLTKPLFNMGEWVGIQNAEWLGKLAISGRDLILLVGGLFLIYKSTAEIHEKLEGEEHANANAKQMKFGQVIVQILLLDIVFSLDSVITAVGMADHVEIMIAAVVVSVGVMLLASEGISRFVNSHPTVKMLALSFLLLIGVSLLAESFDQHIPKGYIYFAMAFSVFIEVLNLKVKARSEKPVKLHNEAELPPKEN
ncbi:TerC family protein [Chitinophaga ginsengisegetis]|uniref:TerC family protein n=1 Tax=Chitinophaga ginsengisegetis TaxID=393003 RepID=UPI000DB9F267|nr:TerC family protein [Chitinophaga ginsengisegetis]MDR6566904.1 putative tellurium resistance membrane protein TerC [Chitinophaga ginsengisegetis]MDR6646634.1 putative tellurium resistance membrane protein TerC [Chitinophaga ginsengisegetis]MDR6652984.1 putative tellurium resistance membrane protein TerC [Chitinophaga ginsengisegetis]